MKPLTSWILTMLAASVAGAQGSPDRLSLVEAVQAAAETHPMIASAAAEAESARASVREARAAREPQLNLNASAFQHEEPMVVTPIHGFTPGQFPEFDETLLQSALTGTYLLYDGGATKARVRQVEAQRSATVAALEAARQTILARTASAYLTILGLSRSLEARDLRLRSLEAELERVQQLRAVGRAAEVEVLRVEAALAAGEAERVEVATQLQLAERALARLTSLAPGRTESSDLADVQITSTDIPSREALESLATDSSPAVQQARDRLAAQRAAVALARAGDRPQLNAVGSSLAFGNSEGFQTEEWNAGVQLRFSLFDGGATRARVARAKASADSAEEQVRLAEREAGEAVDRALADLAQARATVESLEKAVERFIEVARIEKLRLETGVGTQTDYLRAEAELMQARAGLATARYRAMLARVELARVTGQLDVAWFQETFRGAS